MSAISTWNKKIILLRENTNESSMTQRIIMRTGLPTWWLDKIGINNLMTFQKIMGRALNCQKGNLKPLEQVEWWEFPLLSQAGEGLAGSRGIGVPSSTLARLTDYLHLLHTREVRPLYVRKRIRRFIPNQGNTGTGSCFTSISHTEAQRGAWIQVSL